MQVFYGVCCQTSLKKRIDASTESGSGGKRRAPTGDLSGITLARSLRYAGNKGNIRK